LRGEFATTSPSDRLTNFPQDLLSSPPNQRQVEFDITSTAAPKNVPFTGGDDNLAVPGSIRQDAFTRLIQLEQINLFTLLIALVVSLVWGALHALTPGHGKTIVGAYLVGTRGTPIHALYLGLATTITHTLGVFALGLVTLFAAQLIVPERLYPWMSLLSGLFVLGIGASLLVERYRSSGLINPFQKLWSLFTKTSPAILPASPAIEHIQKGDRNHSHGFSLHSAHSHPHPHLGSHSHGGHHHDHDHDGHSHLPPGADGAPVTWRSLLLLGISGGIIPCPSALVVMLAAIALNRIGFGLALVLAFSLGLAAALTAIGLVFIYAGRLFERVPARGKVMRLLPVLSALFITLIGLAITLRALKEAGILSIA
jgi:ABC-type nickel/cobalt efflux system permease component RcnA